MTLSTARRLASHATVAFAFLSITTGGEIPAPLVGLFFVLLIASYFFGERIGRGRAGLFTALTAAVLFVLAGLVVTGRVDMVIAASLFAATLSLNRLFARQSSADDGLLYLGALMMLAGGAALSGEVLYGVCFVGFALTTTAGLTLSHLSRVVEESNTPPRLANRLVAPRLMLGLGLLALVAVVGSLVVFFLFPRVTTNWLARRTPRGGTPIVGFSDTIRLGGHGTLKSDTRVVMRMKLEPDPGVERLELLVKGRSFDLYDGHGWRATAAGSTALMKLDFEREPVTPVRAEIEVLPAAGTSAIFFPGDPVSLSRLRRVPPVPAEQPLLFMKDSLGDIRVVPVPDDGFAYVVETDLGGAPDVRGRGADYPEEILIRYLQLPEQLDPRIPELAQRWTRGLTDPAEKVEAIQSELLRNYRYTTELPGVHDDPLAHFLFERREGHCEFFSTAMAVLLRSVGVPARNVAGYFGARRVDGEGYYLVQGGAAHSWVEVWFPGAGFVPYDPTPPSGRPAFLSGLSQYLTELMEKASMRWQTLVVDYSIYDQFRAVRSLFRGISTGLERLSGRSGDRAGGVLRIFAAMLVLAGAVWAARRVLGVDWGGFGGRRQRTEEVVQIYRQLLEKLSRRGLAKRPSQTPAEFVAEAKRQRRSEYVVLAEVTEQYVAARFGGERLGADELRRMREKVKAI